VNRIGIITTLSLLLFACGGEGNGSPGSSPPISNPAPSPSPSPSPSPTPSPPPPATAEGWKVEYLHIFGLFAGAPTQPAGPLMQASDNNIYGITLSGGRYDCGGGNQGCGSIYKYDGDGISVIRQFNPDDEGGYWPSGGVIEGTDGMLYGLTYFGGTGGGGVAYRVAKNGADFQILHNFGVNDAGGSKPQGELVEASDGYFYGVTAEGGSNICPQIPFSYPNCGTVFKISRNGNFETLYSFGKSVSDGVQPNGTLLLASNGSLYGTTSMGGTNSCSSPNSCGTFFKVTLDGSVTVLYSFGASRDFPISPNGALIQAQDGYIYGTSLSGGPCGCGTVYRMSLDGEFAKVFDFPDDPLSIEGGGPRAIVEGDDGNFYGPTSAGGLYENSGIGGTLYRLSKDGEATVLHSFGPMDQPHEPLGPLMKAADGSFYGVTRSNGELGWQPPYAGAGTLYRLSRTTN